MYTKIILTLFILITFKSVSGQNSSFRKTDWTVIEVKDWTKANKSFSLSKGLLLYQGSDSIAHHFTTRVVDEFVFIKIKIKDLKMIEVLPLKIMTSSGPLGYYWVDPLNDFAKIKGD